MAEDPLVYRDFNIEMTDLKEDGTYQVRVIGQTPGGEMSAAQAETATYNNQSLSGLLTKLDRRRITKDELISLGEQLADLLLPGRVRALFQDSLKALEAGEALRLRLSISSLALAALPWEYTYLQRTPGEKVENDFLVLQPKISITRYETLGSTLEPLEDRGNIQIVVALAAPIDQPELNLDADENAIKTALDALKEKAPNVETAVLEHATRDGLLKSTPGADIFQFGGHGVFEGSELTDDGKLLMKGKILLENEGGDSDPFDSAQLAAILAKAGVRLVLLGACNSAARDEGGAWSGVAPALTRQNIPAVVAMQYKVRDKNAAPFLFYVYMRVLGGYTIDEAVAEARLALYTQSGLEDRDWGVPVIYLRNKDGILFPLPKPVPGKQESPFIRVQRELKTVKGTSIGARIKNMTAGHLEIDEKIDTVEKGGTAIGLDLGVLGGDWDEPSG
jgi:hypothetical protein